MAFKVLFVLTLCYSAIAQKYPCSHAAAALTFKRPTYDFSTRILDRVAQETNGHFVFSPLSTWLQLTALAEGAEGNTLKEIWSVTRHHRPLCFRRKLREFLNKMDDGLKSVSERISVIIVDKLYDVKNGYRREIEKSRTIKVLLLDFSKPIEAANKANEFIEMNTNGVIKDAVLPEDFELNVLLMFDIAYFRNVWKSPFNPVYTKVERFYSEEGISIGEVKMMNQIGYFNLTEISLINARILELPFHSDSQISLLLILPTKGTVEDIYLYLQKIRLSTIFYLFKTKGETLVNVSLPRFNIKTEVDNLPELVYDMGVKRVFYPNLAELKGISDYSVYTSLMTQIANIEVTEQGVRASAAAEFLISGKEPVDFTANKPFAFLLVDRKADIILFAGIYSKPALY